eukprot:725228_1
MSSLYLFLYTMASLSPTLSSLAALNSSNPSRATVPPTTDAIPAPAFSPTVTDQFALCVEGETKSSVNLNGRYDFHHYDYVHEGAVYHGSSNNLYLKPFDTDGKQWLFSDNIHSSWAKASVLAPISAGYVYDIDDVFRNFEVWTGNEYVWDRNMIVVDCTTICLSGHLNSTMNGRYIFQSFDTLTNSSTYYCSSCDHNNGMWLYGWRGTWANSYWLLSSTLNQQSVYTSHCQFTRGGIGARGHYTLPCPNRWSSYTKQNSDLSTSNCKPTSNPTQSTLIQTSDPIRSPTSDPTFNPTLSPSNSPTRPVVYPSIVPSRYHVSVTTSFVVVSVTPDLSGSTTNEGGDDGGLGMININTVLLILTSSVVFCCCACAIVSVFVWCRRSTRNAKHVSMMIITPPHSGHTQSDEPHNAIYGENDAHVQNIEKLMQDVSSDPIIYGDDEVTRGTP